MVIGMQRGAFTKLVWILIFTYFLLPILKLPNLAFLRRKSRFFEIKIAPMLQKIVLINQKRAQKFGSGPKKLCGKFKVERKKFDGKIPKMIPPPKKCHF